MEEFIKQLSTGTQLTYNEASILVNSIYNAAHSLDTAKKVYLEGGVWALKIYKCHLSLGVIY